MEGIECYRTHLIELMLLSKEKMIQVTNNFSTNKEQDVSLNWAMIYPVNMYTQTNML